ncbi:hypothetical protein [Calothrix sp. PCC 6303]|nr:hypothetical protein [Calothrix sp. PCC 6303]AFZ04120.1 hypothetical protein Cal6303_5234 [Calothrix sp. PCC 6303]
MAIIDDNSCESATRIWKIEPRRDLAMLRLYNSGLSTSAAMAIQMI